MELSQYNDHSPSNINAKHINKYGQSHPKLVCVANGMKLSSRSGALSEHKAKKNYHHAGIFKFDKKLAILFPFTTVFYSIIYWSETEP